MAGKKYRNAAAKIDRAKKYTLEEACKLVPETKVAKYDESVDIAVRLGVDPKHADQMVRGTVVLPHGTGKKVRVLVFASGEPNRKKVGKVTRAQVEEIAKTKMPDLNAASLAAAIKTIEGTARSMGLEIQG